MEFIKKNYEKVTLGLVLLILAAAACYLPFYITARRDSLAEKRTSVQGHPKELPAIDTSAVDSAFQRAQYPLNLDYTTNHNTLNPVIWKKLSDGGLIKAQNGKEEGPEALVVLKIKKLYLVVSYGSPSATGYFITIERQGMLREDKRKTQNFVSMQTKGDLVTLREVKGPAEKPTELDLEWNETGEKMVITPEKPFQRVDGFSADLKYPLEVNKTWLDRRVGSKPIVFANGLYNIVAITESNVVVLAESNKKKTTIEFHTVTEPR
jgi:hypothetical protein